MVSNKNPTLQWRAVHFTLRPKTISYLIWILLSAYTISMITLLQKLWILHAYWLYLQFFSDRYRPGLIILTTK